ncbi:hypothetical protein N7468_006306 [Penicillium chermesinum]|uniref:Uncharacterized protein n=1 Tax=Penicillium chermesinum TaxID=63820 RepID=A0A9W9TJH7_9EURO|nr:uncharacterized protein N7468_006306 [Penicillium chermesinum]KAJ5225081.1 hypothetical protein N7468_006306 [Penicillium chermesinum]
MSDGLHLDVNNSHPSYSGTRHRDLYDLDSASFERLIALILDEPCSSTLGATFQGLWIRNHIARAKSRSLIPAFRTYSRSRSNTLRCCCGREDCALLEHNHVALEGLEKDLETAAKLGQREKRQVQAENARIVEENRDLLEQLDNLNNAVLESDEHVQSLTLTLESTEAELRRLTVAAARAAELEAQLALMETEQSRLHETISSVKADERSAVQRWRNAESTLRGLHDQVERIEKEAREERERHEELIQRMERKRTVERELDNAAGRLKGAAAASELGRNSGTHVVSRFVKDILQDNANLQVGIMELREMLDSSNQEVQNLRDQVLCHQPLAGDEGDAEVTPTATLSEELEKGCDQSTSQEEAPYSGKPYSMHSAVGTQSPRRSIHRSQSSGSSMNTVLSQTSVSIPPASSRRWSLQSPALDSLASSPQSAFRTSSIFDRVDRGSDDYSQPTSPDSTVFSSPLISARNVKGLDLPIRPMGNLDNDSAQLENSTDLFNDYLYDRPTILDYHDKQPAIPEESEPSGSGPDKNQSFTGDPSSAPGDDIFDLHMQYTPLRKSASHESLLSIAGMDIHTSTDREARMGIWHPGMRIPRRLVSPSVELSSTPPIISTANIVADRARASDKSSRALLASMAASSIPSDSASVVSVDSNSTSSTTTPGPRKSSALTRRVGGWVRGRWGMAPVSENCDCPGDGNQATTKPASADPPQGEPSPATVTTRRKTSDEPPPLRFRVTGVNQKGPIMGFLPPRPAPVSVQVQGIDENLLRESLAEEAHR